MKKPRPLSRLTIGMMLLSLGGLFLGAVLGYAGTNYYESRLVQSDLAQQGYVLTTDATATANDIRAGRTAYADGRMVTGTMTVLDTADATATADSIVKGKTAYINGELVVGTMDVLSYDEVTPGTEAINLDGGGYLAKDLVIKGDPDLVKENIRRMVTIFGVVGTYDPIVEQTPQGGE